MIFEIVEYIIIESGLLSYIPLSEQPDNCPAEFRISLLRFAFSLLRFVWVLPGVVYGADPGGGLY